MALAKRCRHLAALIVGASLAGGIASGQITFDRILDGEPENWLTYGGTPLSQRYSELTEITTDNVDDLQLEWVLQVRSLPGSTKFEATPIVADGVMYTVRPPYEVVALDAATGRIYWTYDHLPAEPTNCCGDNNRGLAIHGDRLFMATLDARLISLDARTGELLWDVQVASPGQGYAFTLAPLVVKDRVIIGPAGGEFGIRGFLAAFDVTTGDEVWRFDTVPAPGEPGNETWGGDSWMRGGGPVWVTGSYDPELNLTYWGIGNPGPDWNGDLRPGDNLYTSSVVALDANTGELAWHFQFTPHDEFDYDSVQVPVLASMEWQGRMRNVMLWANRNGFFYVLDRGTGEFLLGRPFVKVTWASGLDRSGRPIVFPGKTPSVEGTLIYPGNQGGTNWYNPSFSPSTGLFYVSTWEDTFSVYRKDPDVEYVEGQVFGGGAPTVPVGLTPRPTWTRLEEEGYYGAVQAIDPTTGLQEWIFKMADVTDAGILTTAADVLFSGGREGYFYALDARTGDLLWRASLGGPIANGPISYAVDGRQYVSVAAGNGLFTFSLPR